MKEDTFHVQKDSYRIGNPGSGCSRPWITNWEAFNRYLINTSWKNLHIGIGPIAIGERKP
jgi:hypothetical protein